jgi:hypothetical protein
MMSTSGILGCLTFSRHPERRQLALIARLLTTRSSALSGASSLRG